MFGYVEKELNRTSTKQKRANKTIGHVNKTIQYAIISMNGNELENINVTNICDKEENEHK